MTDNQRIDVLKIKEAAERAQACGMSVSEYTIRRAIRTGQLPCRIVGRTYLISWNNLVNWITCANGCDNPTSATHLKSRLLQIIISVRA